jgi:CHASE3 domain sensor protein
MTRSSLGALAAAALGVCCAVVLVAANFVNSRAAAATAREVDVSWDAIQKAEEILSLLRDAEIGQRGYLLVGRREYLLPYSNAVDRVFPAIEQLQVPVQNDPIQRSRARTLQTLAGQKMSEMRVTIEMMDAGNRDGALATVDTDLGKNRMDEIRKTVAEIQRHERAELAKRATRAAQATHRVLLTSIIAVVLVAVSLLVPVVCFSPSAARSRELPSS